MPTAGDMASFSRFLKLSRLQGLIIELRPKLKDVICVDSDCMLTIDLPAGPTSSKSKVVLAHAIGGGWVHWLIVGPTWTTFITSIWDPSTSDSVVAEAVVATYDACLAHGALASPWRWGEPERTKIVEAAELLTERGHAVGAVASVNRFVPDYIEGADRPRFVPSNFGDALRLDLDWGVATLARKPTLGWVLDVNNDLTTRRLDLASFSTGVASAEPGCRTEDLVAVVHAVDLAIEAGPWNPSEGWIGGVDLFLAESPLHHAVSWWMRELGYADSYAPDHGPTGVVANHVKILAKDSSVGLADVQRAFASATVKGKKLIMFATSPYTKNARDWADKAHVPLFNVRIDDYKLSPASELAKEHIPAVI